MTGLTNRINAPKRQAIFQEVRMPELFEDKIDEPIRFRGGWKGLYIFVLIYAALQILLLYLFTLAFNHS